MGGKLKDFSKSVMSVSVKFEKCAEKIIEGIGCFGVIVFLKHYWQFFPHGCQFDDIDFKLQ